MKKKNFLKDKFIFLSWSLDELPTKIMKTKKYQIMQTKSTKSKYPIRALRYWWVEKKLTLEIAKNSLLGKTTNIVDMGCNKGNIKRFIGNLANAKWIGLDWKIDKKTLADCNYDITLECDFNKRLPLEDNSIDVLILLHVIEHLPNPDFTIKEIARVLKPNAILLAGSPILPKFIAYFRHKQLQNKFLKNPQKQLGRHINSMDCIWWNRLLKKNNLKTEIFTGTFFTRLSGNILENYKWWVKLNLLWGAIFPSLGGELYIAARKEKV